MAQGIKSIFVCSNCDAQFPKWNGRCSECGAWGTLQAEVSDARDEKKEAAKKLGAAEAIDLSRLPVADLPRFSTVLGEVDRVLGGGLVEGALVLLSGEPGIGKSTLIAQIAGAISSGGLVLYASGEESPAQVKARLDRLGCPLNNLRFISETSLEKVAAAASQLKPRLLVVDSIQTIYSSVIPAEAGSLAQIRQAAVRFLELAKEEGVVVCLIGHITKDGQVAGPKSLEHIVDVVLYLESEPSLGYCLLRSAKNRFGSTSELGVLEMTGSGFREVKDPSLAFFESGISAAPGSVISCVMEGARPFLLNLQALVSKTVFGYPQRKSSGFDLNRLQVLSAVISKRTKVNLVSQDIILNIAGGFKMADPSLDLAACAAIISSYKNKGLDSKTLVLGEVGLGGELRPVSRLEERLKEAERLGFKSAIIPNLSVKSKLKLIKLGQLDKLLEIF